METTPNPLQTERKLKEIHEYARQAFQLFVSWFVFFAGVNYATMGWLLKPSGPPNRTLLIVVAILFIVQNILGIIACFRVRKYLKQSSSDLLELEKLIAGMSESQSEAKSSLPIEFYSAVINLMGLALVGIVAAWGFFLCSAIHSTPPSAYI